MRFQKHVIDPEEAELSALRATGDLDGARVLEIGCGDGRLTLGYAESARSVVAIDPSTTAIDQARRALPRSLSGRVHFKVGSAVELYRPATKFDVALFSHSL